MSLTSLPQSPNLCNSIDLRSFVEFMAIILLMVLEDPPKLLHTLPQVLV